MKKRMMRLLDALKIARYRKDYGEALRIVARIFKVREEARLNASSN